MYLKDIVYIIVILYFLDIWYLFVNKYIYFIDLNWFSMKWWNINVVLVNKLDIKYFKYICFIFFLLVLVFWVSNIEMIV